MKWADKITERLDEMQRECSLEDISDGKRYQGEDLAKVDCQDCVGCSDCCHDMGNTIILDPRDIYELTKGLQQTMEQLLTTTIELNVVDGIILPNLKMQKQGNQCAYLNKKGRCRIHDIRPGICRLFPLGRVYENGGFSYFLQDKECKSNHRSKIRIRKWINLPEWKTYEKFVLAWHDYVKATIERQREASEEEKKQICVRLLTVFYLTPYQEQDFYAQFFQRIEKENDLNNTM